MLAVFDMLGTDRQMGMAPGPIPWSSFMRWCRAFGATEDMHDYLWVLIQGMDAVYLKHVQKKVGKPSGGQGR